MADSKITALTALTAADPANDMIPIVDVSDTPPASGNTKRISINNILACSPSATLASLNVTGSSIPANGLYLPTTNTLEFAANSLAQYRIAPLGVFSWYDGAGGTRMTLNSSGLFLGISSQAFAEKFRVYGSYTLMDDGAFTGFLGKASSLGVSGATTDFAIRSSNALIFLSGGATERMRIDTSGNVGIGVTPSAWGSGFRYVQAGPGCAYGTNGSVDRTDLAANWYYNGGDKYINATGKASIFQQSGGAFFWLSTNTASGGAGSAMTLNTNMTLDASGNLLVGTTAAAAGRLDVRRTTVGRGINYFSTASGDLAQVGLYIAKFDNDSTTSQKFIAFSINNDSAGSGQINANGANQAAFGSFSDSRLKENIVSLPSQLDNILSLRPVEFDYKDGSGHQIGFVAQEMQQVYSDAVGESDGFLTVTGWSKTEARLVSAIKELAAKVQALEAKLA